MEQAHKTRQKLRPVGSALSPNGLPFQPAGMVSLANLDRIIRIDTSSRRVVVQAGARVNQVVEALRPHGLTLPNFASITEQQVGGLIQVGAHGTGVKFPPIDADVVALKLITPAAGTLSLSIDDDNPSLFLLARVALGLMGVVAEVTLQCVPAHRLVERTVVLSRDEVSRQHADLQRNNRHVRYLWIPYTDDVVVVTCNMEKADDDAEVAQLAAPPLFSNAERLEAARALLKGHPDCKLTSQQIEQLAFTSLRDELLAMAPLDVAWVKRVNEAEAQFWRRSEGLRVDWSDSILQFDCGGQQWVSEVAFPVDDKKPLSDVKYTRKLLDMIEREDIPAPAPIEQRWTAASSSPLSPAGEKPERDLADVYSWVGIIMYLPDVEVDAKNRRLITEAFKKYKGLCEKHLWADARAVEHWAKIEMPGNDVETDLLQFRTREKFPVEALKAVCNIFDPHGILRNDLMDTIFGMKVGKT